CDRRWMPNHDRFECQTAIDSDAILQAGKALRAGGGADFIFSASERVVMAFRLFAGALVCLRDVLCGGERVRA
ncbi:hypothetical protein, partial [Salmonella sp. ZJHZ19_0069]|uniref:hypothetical protein n=1 Tax=Salmonella sp. ZJHZ19_0069 TaxID=3159586 RepID=UPI00397CD0DE